MNGWVTTVALALALQLPFLFALGLNFDVCSRHNFLLAGSYALAMNVAVSLATVGAASIILVLATVAAAFATLCAAELLCYVPLERLRRTPDEILVASLGLNVVAEQAISVKFGDAVRFPPLTSAATNTVFGDLVAANATGFAIVVGFSLVASVVFVLKRTEVGARLSALSENPELFKTVGFSIQYWRLVAIAIVAFLIGSSAITAISLTGVYPSIGFNLVVLGFLTSLLGGPVYRARYWFVGSLVVFTNQLIGFLLPAQWQRLTLYLLLFAAVAATRRRVEAGAG